MSGSDDKQREAIEADADFEAWLGAYWPLWKQHVGSVRYVELKRTFMAGRESCAIDLMPRSSAAELADAVVAAIGPAGHLLGAAPSHGAVTTEWCRAGEFGCECGRMENEPCPHPHPGAAAMGKAAPSSRAATEQEPCAWRYRYGKTGMWKYADRPEDMNPSPEYEREPLYALPWAQSSATLTPKDAALREGAAILLQVAEMEEHNEAMFKGTWKKGAKAWSGEFIERLRTEGMAKVREAMGAAPDGRANAKEKS